MIRVSSGLFARSRNPHREIGNSCRRVGWFYRVVIIGRVIPVSTQTTLKGGPLLTNFSNVYADEYSSIQGVHLSSIDTRSGIKYPVTRDSRIIPART